MQTYLPYLRTSLTEPLVKKDADGVPDVIKLMDQYDIIKEDISVSLTRPISPKATCTASVMQWLACLPQVQ
jgi:hypothetical protein